jgi:hypothetical protein
MNALFHEQQTQQNAPHAALIIDATMVSVTAASLAATVGDAASSLGSWAYKVRTPLSTIPIDSEP